ncbi:zinc finger, CCHC-type containing protein [Tanacetum coccineum]
MVVAAMKHMASNFAKLYKFEGVDFRRWQKKMHFLLSNMSVVYVPTTPILEDELWDSLEAKYMAEDASSKKFFHKKQELTLVELGSHLRIEESLRAQDSDKPKGNNVVGPHLKSTSKLNDSILWHARLGHVHFKRMQDMSKDGLIPAFDMDTEKCKGVFLFPLIPLIR